MATYVLTIAGVTKTMEPSWSIAESMNGMGRFDFSVQSLDSSYRPALDASVVLTEDGTRIFGGFVDTPREVGLGNSGATDGITTRIGAVDCNSLASRRLVNETFAVGTTLRSILSTLRTNYLNDYGTSTNIYINGSTVTTGASLAAELTYEDRRLDEVFTEIANIFGYGWLIDYSNILRYTTPGSNAAPFNIAAGDGNTEGDVTVEPTREDYANRVIVSAGTGTAPQSQSFTANGSATSWAVDLPATNDDVTFELNGTPVPIGPYAPGDPSSLFAYQWDPVTHTIYQRSGDTAAANGTTLDIDYVAQYPFRHVVNDTAEQTAHGIRETKVDAPSAFTADAAEEVGQAVLAQRTLTRKKVTYITSQDGVHPGQTQTINLPKRNVNATFLVTETRIQRIGGNVVRRFVTAVEGTTYPGSWKDVIRGWSTGGSGGGGSTAAPPILTTQTRSFPDYVESFTDIGDTTDQMLARLVASLSTGHDASGPAAVLQALAADRFAIVCETTAGGPQLKFVDLDHATLSYVMRLYEAGGEWYFAPSAVMNAAGGVNLGRNNSGERWNYLDVLDVAAVNGYYERSRAARMGEWTNVAHSAGLYTGSGSMTWGVDLADQIELAYTYVGKTLFVSGRIENSDVGGTASAALQITIPDGKTAARLSIGFAWVDDAGAGFAAGFCQVSAGGTVIRIGKADGANWTLTTGDNTDVRFTIAIEVQ